jgi:DNA replication licensing factor MCM5
MHLQPIVLPQHVEEAHRLFRISTLNAAASGMSNAAGKQIPAEMTGLVQKIEEAVKRRVAIGTRIAYPKLQQEMLSRYDNQRAIDLAIMSLVKRDDLVYHEGRKVLERKR